MKRAFCPKNCYDRYDKKIPYQRNPRKKQFERKRIEREARVLLREYTTGCSYHTPSSQSQYRSA